MLAYLGHTGFQGRGRVLPLPLVEGPGRAGPHGHGSPVACNPQVHVARPQETPDRPTEPIECTLILQTNSHDFSYLLLAPFTTGLTQPGLPRSPVYSAAPPLAPAPVASSSPRGIPTSENKTCHSMACKVHLCLSSSRSTRCDSKFYQRRILLIPVYVCMYLFTTNLRRVPKSMVTT